MKRLLFAIVDRYKNRHLVIASNPVSAKVGLARKLGSHIGPFEAFAPTVQEQEAIASGRLEAFEPVAEPVLGAIYREQSEKELKQAEKKFGKKFPKNKFHKGVAG